MGNILKTLANNKIICSMAEGRRLLRENAIKINGETVSENTELGAGEHVISIGKKRIFNLSLSGCPQCGASHANESVCHSCGFVFEEN